MPYTELKVVEQPIIRWLQELGWRYVHADEMKRQPEEPFDLPTLEQSIRQLNPGVVLEDGDVQKVLTQLRKLSNDINGNKEFFEWLKGERSLVLRPGEKAQTIRLVDFDDLENNTFVVTNQFKFAGYENIRLDIVLMVNGIPLVVIEAKTPTRFTVDYHEAIRQILRYWKEAPQLLKYVALTCATDGIEFRYDYVTDDKFFEWKGPPAMDPIEPSVRGLFNRQALLDFVSNFVVFETERGQVRKKIAMYQQVAAANKVVSRVLDGEVRKGLVWHTQGSGKTLTMLLAAWKLKKAPQLDNPTILLVVDRIDLESQLWGSFSNVDLPYTAKAQSAKELVEKLRHESREVIITTIQKFEEVREVLSERTNIIVFIDEAHRTQYGRLAMYMRNAFPNAFTFGFTGTPIDKGPWGKSTFQTFCPPGERYLDKYSIGQSIEDGATVKIVYQPRLMKYHIDQETLDREFLGITAELTEEQQDRVLETSATLRTALKSKDRIDRVAQDIAQHFKAHIEPNGFKAQLVAVDREACALYKQALDKYLPPEYSVVIFTPSANDLELLKECVKDEKKKEKLVKEIAQGSFQKLNENPRILIVTDMLLTGFDAPIEQVMYLDKPLRDHKLLQAIARTNRPYPGKEAGIIIDYVGLFRNLVKALNFEQEEVAEVAHQYDVLKEDFGQTLEQLLRLFKGVKRDDTRESLMTALGVLEDEARVKEFKERFGKLRILYETIAPDPELMGYLDDYSWLIEINEAYNKVYNRRYGDLAHYQEKTKQLIKDELLLDRLEKKLPTFEIDRQYLKNLERERYSDDQKVMEMKYALEYHIRINLETNPIYETLSQRLERILKTKDRATLLRELEEVTKQVVEAEEQIRKSGITREEYALLTVMKKHVAPARDSELLTFAKTLLSDVKAKVFKDWQKKVSVVKSVEKAIFDRCFERFQALDLSTVSAMTEELVKFIRKYNP